MLFRSLERQPCGIPAVEERQTLSPGRADPPAASHERTSGEEGRLDGRNIVARDIARRIGARNKDLQARRVRVSMVGHAESFGRFWKVSNAKLESEDWLRFERSMNATVSASDCALNSSQMIAAV